MNKEQFVENLRLKGFEINLDTSFKVSDTYFNNVYHAEVNGKSVKITFYSDFENRPLISNEMKEKWLTDLKSGEFQQGKCYLHKNGKFCCLGVWAYSKIRQLDKAEYILGCYSNTVLNESDDLAKIIGVGGYFHGFSIDNWHSIAILNDTQDNYDLVIWVIENFF